MGVTPTCWRPPFGDIDDRIRAIAAALGLQSILWKYDSFDWKVNAGGATPDQVNKNYDDFANVAKSGGFNTVS
jgi:peptidoglycan/xylan/chitin deacetylase (PgdA/CDA1 family)